MSDRQSLIKAVKELCRKRSLELTESSERHLRIFTDHASGITLFLEINEEPTDFSFYFLERTYDVIYNGDRTDAHVVISLMLACFLRSFDDGMSCSLYDVSHPVIEDEIYGRYIVPIQIPSFSKISSWSQLQSAVIKLIDALDLWRFILWNYVGCPCDECVKEDQTQHLKDFDIPPEIFKATNKVIPPSKHINHNNRLRTKWNFYYDMKKEVTVVKSERFSSYLVNIYSSKENESMEVDGVNGRMIVEEEIKNFVSFKSIKKINKLLSKLSGNSKIKCNTVFPMENVVVAVAEPYIVGFGRLGGMFEFKKERELTRKRNNRESEVLFPIPVFEWNESICPDQFEALIKALLELEPNVKRVRRPAPINQGDKARDLMIEWLVVNEAVMSEAHPPTSLIKVVGQCKASKSTVGKNNTSDSFRKSKGTLLS